MTAERLEQLFIEAIKLPPSERMGFLKSVCAGDSELLQRLEAMLKAHGRAERLAFFNPKPPIPGREQPGQRIGPYWLREQLGEGGWGIVFLAEQEKPVRRRVALKVIKAGLDTRNVIARFEAEREALARMDHPNIAKVLDAGATEAGRPYFVMELVSGPRITEYCDRMKLGVSDRLELFTKVCQAVQHAHQKGIIHRDLKPSNILVAEQDGVPGPKIIDFGIAKATEGRLTDHTAYTDGPQLLGTPAYMSPEQTMTPNPDVDTRSDIYSLGAILFELLVGKTPFDSKKLQEGGWEEMCRTIREKDPLRLSALLATLSESERTTIALDRSTGAPQLAARMSGDLDWIVMKCLAKERGRRYETANGLAADLKRHLADEPVVARPPSASYRLQKAIRRNKLAFISAAAMAGILLLATIVSTQQAGRAKQAERTASALEGKERELRREADQQRQWAEQNLYGADIYSAARDLAVGNRGHALELLGKYRRKTEQADLRGWEWRYLWKSCQGKEQFTLAGHKGMVVALVFSPDNKTLFSGDMDGVVRIWDLGSRKEVATLPVARRITSLALSPDGKALMIGSPAGVAIHDGASFARVRQLPGAKGLLALSPDGRTLVTDGADAAIVWDVPSLKPLHRADSRLGSIPARTQVSFSPDGNMVAIPFHREGRFEIKVWNAAALREKGFQEPPLSVLQQGGKVTPGFAATQQNYPRANAIVFSKHAAILATGKLKQVDGQKGVQFWDPQTGLPLSPLESSGEVLNMAFLPDGKTLLTYNHEPDFRLWDISSHTNIAFLRVVPGHEDEIWSVAIAPSGQMVASGSKEGMIKVWKTETFLKPPEVKDVIDASNLAEVGFGQDGRTMFSVSWDSAFRSWDTETLQPRAFADLPHPFIVALISPQGTHLALGLANGSVGLWKIPGPSDRPQFSRELLPPQPESSKPFFFTVKQDAELSPAFPLMTWSGDGKKLAAFVHDLDVWDIVAGQSDRKLSLPAKPDAIALSPDGTILAAGSGPDIQLWEVKTGRQLSTCVGHREWIVELAFSPDGKTLASGSFDGTAALWGVPGGGLRWKLTSHTKPVRHVAFSPDNRTLATRGLDNTVRLWHVPTGRELMAIESLPSDWDPRFVGARFSSDGAMMAVGVLSPAQIRFFRAPSLADIDADEVHGR